MNLRKILIYKKIEINDIIKIGEATAIVKWVDNEEKYSDNNSSIVLQLNYKDKNIFTVQFHPEACPGPQDCAYLFDEFIAKIEDRKENKKCQRTNK